MIHYLHTIVMKCFAIDHHTVTVTVTVIGFVIVIAIVMFGHTVIVVMDIVIECFVEIGKMLHLVKHI